MSLRSILSVALVSSLLLSPLLAQDRTRGRRTKPKPEFTNPGPQQYVEISKETTYVTEPLDSRGYPDYFAAINRKMSAGVTPENNAAVLLWSVLDVEDMDEKFIQGVKRALGTDPFTEGRPIMVDIGDFANTKTEGLGPDASGIIFNAISEKQGKSQSEIWTKEQYPEIVEWLELNEDALAVVIKATQRTKYFSPLIQTQEGESLISALLPNVQNYRTMARLLSSRANLALGENRLDDAMRDIEAMKRLAVYTAQGSTVIELLVGIAIESISAEVEKNLLFHPEFDGDQRDAFRQRLAAIPRFPEALDVIGFGERYMGLSAIVMLARDFHGDLNTADDESAFDALLGFGGTDDRFIKTFFGSSIDWNIILRMWNDEYDAIAEMKDLPRAEQFALFARRMEEITNVREEMSDALNVTRIMLGGTRPRSELMGKILFSLLLPALEQVLVAQDRHTMKQTVMDVAYTLQDYRDDNGAYPSSLGQLVPKYLQEVPQDAFSDGPLSYKSDGTSFNVYSLGQNKTDDGGYGYNDEKENAAGEQTDDLFVRTPGWGE